MYYESIPENTLMKDVIDKTATEFGLVFKFMLSFKSRSVLVRRDIKFYVSKISTKTP